MSHSHNHDEQPAATLIDDPEPGSTWFVSLAGSIVFIALVLGIIVFYFRVDDQLIKEVVVDARVAALDTMKAEQNQLLSDYLVYPEKQTDGKSLDRLRIPINRAMELVAADFASKPRSDATSSVNSQVSAQSSDQSGTGGAAQ